ncbi:MAG: hypothetical protein AB7E12_13840 [Burkholderiaceae bacterium]
MSSPQDVDRALVELMQMSSNRLIGRIRPLLPTIDAQLRAGVSRKDIVQALQANGINVSMRYLDTALYRWRRKRKAETAAGHPSTQQRSAPLSMPPGTQIPLLPDALEKAAPGAERPPTVINRADVARLRRSQATDLNYLAQLGKKSSSRRNP